MESTIKVKDEIYFSKPPLMKTKKIIRKVYTDRPPYDSEDVIPETRYLSINEYNVHEFTQFVHDNLIMFDSDEDAINYLKCLNNTWGGTMFIDTIIVFDDTDKNEQ